jgi:hypothetical protein
VPGGRPPTGVVLLSNGGRLRLDAAGCPQYATPECGSVPDLVVQDKAGERILEEMLAGADQRLGGESDAGGASVLKVSADPAGSSHPRQVARPRAAAAAAGDRQRPVDERDHHAAQGRRHRPGAAHGRSRHPAAIADPGRLREPGHRRGAIETGNLDAISREIDWVIKYQLIERYRAAHDLPLSAPQVAQADLAYHDLNRARGLYYQLQRDGAVERTTRDTDILEAKTHPPHGSHRQPG